MNTNHTRHEPGSKGDVFFLLLHQSAIDNCAEMLSNMNNIQLVVSHSERCKNILHEKVPLHEQRTYRFFLDHKEASNLSYQLQMQERCGEDDYNLVKDMVPTWMEEERVIFFQSYNPMDMDVMKRPFVLVIQTKEMLERTKYITPDSAWVLDSTFTTNHWGMPLFGAMCPNKAGLGMPVFLMICSNDNESGQVETTLYLTLKVVFGNMGFIRPNAIVIDKDKTERIAILKVIKEDRFCWEDEQIGGIQTKCQLLVCWFHAKKVWVEHLLPKVPEERCNDLYKLMCNMLEVVTEGDFNEAYQTLRINYQGHPGVLQYVEKGWAGKNSPWKKLWPRWSRMFLHRHANTTNL